MSLHEAKIKVRQAVGTLIKDKTQDHQGYNYMSHDKVTELVVGAMHQMGIVHTPTTESWALDDGALLIVVSLSFRMADDEYTEKSQWIACDRMRSGTTPGALASYGVKTGLLKYFGVVTGEEDLEEHTERPAMQIKGTSYSADRRRSKQGEESPSRSEKIAARLMDLMDALHLSPEERAEIGEQNGGPSFWNDESKMTEVGKVLAARLKEQ